MDRDPGLGGRLLYGGHSLRLFDGLRFNALESYGGGQLESLDETHCSRQHADHDSLSDRGSRRLGAWRLPRRRQHAERGPEDVGHREPGGGVPGGPANVPLTYTLDAGETLQFTQGQELTGSPIESDKPIGLFAGHPCVNVPTGEPYCDHAEQQIPPVQALGHEYIAVTYRQRGTSPENPPWRIIGAVDGTKLWYSSPVGGPSTINSGQVVEFPTGTPFSVKSQDGDHPFLLIGTMTGATDVMPSDGYGDADVVRSVPTDQYLSRYVFFTDPTYPETNLVVTRKRTNGAYSDVTLDCAGTLGGWQTIDADHEFTRVDLVRHDFQPQGKCDNGRHEMSSDAPFGLTVWGWGTPETSSYTGYVSYGYPAGEDVQTLTTVVVPPAPK